VTSMPRRTALIVAVPEAAAYYDLGDGVPAHVTVLFPFAPPDEVDEGALDALFAPFAPFDFTLDRSERWAAAVVVLPARPDPFVALTRAVWSRWPAWSPYGGKHETIVPHLTTTSEGIPLPLAARCSDVRLIEEDDRGRWRTRRTFALQGVA